MRCQPLLFVFSRNLRKIIPSRAGEGCWIIDANGRRYLTLPQAAVSHRHGVLKSAAMASNPIESPSATHAIPLDPRKKSPPILAIAREIFRMAAASTSPPRLEAPKRHQTRAQYFSKPISSGIACFPQAEYHGRPIGAMSSAATSAPGFRTRHDPMGANVAPVFATLPVLAKRIPNAI